MTQKYFSLWISFSLGHWCLQFINQFSHPYPFGFLQVSFIYCKSFDERIYEEHSLSLWQLQENPEDAFGGNLLLQCQWHQHIHTIPKCPIFSLIYVSLVDNEKFQQLSDAVLSHWASCSLPEARAPLHGGVWQTLDKILTRVVS